MKFPHHAGPLLNMISEARKSLENKNEAGSILLVVMKLFSGCTLPSPGNLDSAVLIPSAFIAGQRSLGSHNDKFVSLASAWANKLPESCAPHPPPTSGWGGLGWWWGCLSWVQLHRPRCCNYVGFYHPRLVYLFLKLEFVTPMSSHSQL